MKTYEIGNETVNIEITEKSGADGRSHKDRFAKYAAAVENKNREEGKNE